MDHMAIKLHALEGSMWCILPASKDKTGGTKREGMIAGFLSGERERGEKEGGTIEFAPGSCWDEILRSCWLPVNAIDQVGR